jgi:hypothetical protein
MVKRCKDCGTEKPLDQFHEHRMMKDGHINVCKDCKKQYYINYQIRISNKELEKKRQHGTT